MLKRRPAREKICSPTRVQLIGKATGEAIENAEIDTHTGLLHAEEDGSECQIHFIDALQAGFFDF